MKVDEYLRNQNAVWDVETGWRALADDILAVTGIEAEQGCLDAILYLLLRDGEILAQASRAVSYDEVSNLARKAYKRARLGDMTSDGFLDGVTNGTRARLIEALHAEIRKALDMSA